MVNREDPHIRTLAQKTQATNRDDLHLRTAAQKEPAAGGTTRSFGVIIG